MRKICTKILLSVLVAMCIISAASLYMPVKATSDNGIMPLSGYEYTFSFKGNYGIVRGYTGTRLQVTVNGYANNNNNETITLRMYISKTNSTITRTFLTDQNDHIYSNISLGSGGSDVTFTFTGANPAITINMYFHTISG